MKIMNCPLNGPRNISEFVYLGEYKDLPDATSGASEWAEFTFFENNTAGIVREWWIHAPTNYVFIVERNTMTEEILKTLKVPVKNPANRT